MNKLVISIVLLFGAASLSACLDLSSATSKEVNVLGSFPSPTQSYVATSYNTSGGGAPGWCYVQVNVRKLSEQFDSDGGVVFTTRCNVKPDVKWESERKLSISYPADAIVYTQKKVWGKDEPVEISFLPQ